MNNGIQILEKPDWISWEDISVLLESAHQSNRVKGIVMSHQNMKGEEIKAMLGDQGRLFVAISHGRMVGTAALKPKQASFWFGRCFFAYYCFAGILPEFNGLGIYKQLNEARDKCVKSLEIDKLLFNTHPKNKRVIEVSLRLGYKKVGYTNSNGHPYVYMVKWLNGCPFSSLKCRYEYLKCKYFVLFKYFVKCGFLKMKSVLG